MEENKTGFDLIMEIRITIKETDQLLELQTAIFNRLVWLHKYPTILQNKDTEGGRIINCEIESIKKSISYLEDLQKQIELEITGFRLL